MDPQQTRAGRVAIAALFALAQVADVVTTDGFLTDGSGRVETNPLMAYAMQQGDYRLWKLAVAAAILAIWWARGAKLRWGVAFTVLATLPPLSNYFNLL
jgi:hypothetical protein